MRESWRQPPIASQGLPAGVPSPAGRPLISGWSTSPPRPRPKQCSAGSRRPGSRPGRRRSATTCPSSRWLATTPRR